ncbi:MAG: threonine--tRNA ligase, partial [Marmoricola sp.]
MSDVLVTVISPAGKAEQAVTTGTKAWELFKDEPDVIAARVFTGSTAEAKLKDLAYELASGDEVEGVLIDSVDGRDILRHSTAHVMAQAVQDLFPDAKLGIGPPVENGFYYDFDVETPFVPEDLAKIETRMRKIIKDNQRFSRRVTNDDDARVELADEPYKLELIGLKGSAAEAAEGASAEVGAGELTIYDNLDRNGEVAWKDLCRGPHLPSTRHIPAFKLTRSAAAYWRG